VEAPGGEKWEHLKSGGKQWQATPKNLPRMQHTSRLSEFWSLPRPAKGLNTNSNNNYSTRDDMKDLGESSKEVVSLGRNHGMRLRAREVSQLQLR